MKGNKFSMGDFKSSFKTRSFRVGSYSVAAAIVVIAIAVVINLLAGALPADWTQYDTSRQQLFTLSEQTKGIVSNLQKEVTVYFIARNGSEDTYISQLLEKYDSLSKNLTVVLKDPDLYPNFAQQYTDSYTEGSLVVVCGDRYRYVDYNDIYVLDYTSYYYYGTEDWTFYGEQELTSAIDFVTSDYTPKIYLLTGHGEASLGDTFTSAISTENMEAAELSLLTVDAVPEDADVVMIYGPQSDISSDEKEMLEAYLAAGGSLMLLSDLPEEGSFSNLSALMAAYGVTAAEGIVLEGNRNYYYQLPYYLLPDQNSHAITDPLIDCGYYVLIGAAQGLTDGDIPDGVTVTELLTTSGDSFSKVAGYNLTTYEKEDGDISGPFSVASLISDSNSGSNLIWVTASTLLDETINAAVSGSNQDLFLNMLEYLIDPDSSSISIRAKTLTDEYLTMDSATSNTLAVLLIGVLPVGYIAIGITVWYRRKRR